MSSVICSDLAFQCIAPNIRSEHENRHWHVKQNRFTVEKIFVELGSESLRNRQILRCHFVAPMGAQNAGNIPWQSLRSAAGDAVWTATLKALKHMRPCLSPDRLIAILTKELSGVGHSDMLWRSLKLPFFNGTMASLPCILACAYLWILYIRSLRLHVASVPESPQADAELKDVQALAGSCFICACDLKKGISVTEAYKSNRRCKLGAIAIRWANL